MSKGKTSHNNKVSVAPFGRTMKTVLNETGNALWFIKSSFQTLMAHLSRRLARRIHHNFRF
jgi:hypothetical protein